MIKSYIFNLILSTQKPYGVWDAIAILPIKEAKSHRTYDIPINSSLKMSFWVLEIERMKVCVTIKLFLFPPQHTNKVIILIPCFPLELRSVSLSLVGNAWDEKRYIIKKLFYFAVRSGLRCCFCFLCSATKLHSEHFTIIFSYFWQSTAYECFSSSGDYRAINARHTPEVFFQWSSFLLYLNMHFSY